MYTRSKKSQPKPRGCVHILPIFQVYMRAYRLASHRHIAQNCIRGTCLEIPPFKRLLKLVVSIFVSIHYFLNKIFATRWGTSDEASANLNVAVFHPFRRDAPAPTHYGRRRSTLGCGSISRYGVSWGVKETTDQKIERDGAGLSRPWGWRHFFQFKRQNELKDGVLRWGEY